MRRYTLTARLKGTTRRAILWADDDYSAAFVAVAAIARCAERETDKNLYPVWCQGEIVLLRADGTTVRTMDAKV